MLDKNNKVFVNIKGTRYEIEFVKNSNQLFGNILGVTDYSDHKIVILDDVESFEDFKDTLIHELIHATLYECGHEFYKDESMVFILTMLFKSILKNSVEILETYNELKKSL